MYLSDFMAFQNFQKSRHKSFFGKLVSFTAIFGLQYLLKKIKWVIEISQVEFVSKVDEEKLKEKIYL